MTIKNKALMENEENKLFLTQVMPFSQVPEDRNFFLFYSLLVFKKLAEKNQI
jgi:hypothetical protein